MDIATYDILPLNLINVAAITLPWVELFAGVMLVTGVYSRAASIMVSCMMVIFLAALISALVAGLDMSCGCFASSAANSGDTISYKTVLRDIWWLALSVYILFFDHTPVGVMHILKRKPGKNA